MTSKMPHPAKVDVKPLQDLRFWSGRSIIPGYSRAFKSQVTAAGGLHPHRKTKKAEKNGGRLLVNRGRY
jgi:hypothetical protein